jgi:hypothetical protein
MTGQNTSKPASIRANAVIKPDDLAYRNLAWAIASPPLMEHFDDQSIWPDSNWYRELTSTLSQLHGSPPLPPRPHHFRLGGYFEELLIWWLKQSHGVNLIEANLAVRTRKRTIGEFDLLVDNGGDMEHWEVAVKFYLGKGDLRQADHWFGPNTADRLDVKLARLTQHQLRLSSHPVARRLLQDKGIALARSRCIMKGRLYYPWDLFAGNDFDHLSKVSPNHEKGWWVSRTDFLKWHAPQSYRWVFLPKQHWLSTIIPNDRIPEMDFRETRDFVTQPGQPQAIQLAAMIDGREVSRGFVVDERWLERVGRQ